MIYQNWVKWKRPYFRIITIYSQDLWKLFASIINILYCSQFIFLTNSNSNKKGKNKKSKEKKEKKSKKSKKSKSNHEPEVEIVQVNGGSSNDKTTSASKSAHDQTDDLEFWLSPSKQVPTQNVKQEPNLNLLAAQENSSKSEGEKSKKKHKKKSSKHDKTEKKVNGVVSGNNNHTVGFWYEDMTQKINGIRGS